MDLASQNQKGFQGPQTSGTCRGPKRKTSLHWLLWVPPRLTCSGARRTLRLFFCEAQRWSWKALAS